MTASCQLKWARHSWWRYRIGSDCHVLRNAKRLTSFSSIHNKRAIRDRGQDGAGFLLLIQLVIPAWVLGVPLRGEVAAVAAGPG